jgi:hypothetical protein
MPLERTVANLSLLTRRVLHLVEMISHSYHEIAVIAAEVQRMNGIMHDDHSMGRRSHASFVLID